MLVPARSSLLVPNVCKTTTLYGFLLGPLPFHTLLIAVGSVERPLLSAQVTTVSPDISLGS